MITDHARRESVLFSSWVPDRNFKRALRNLEGRTQVHCIPTEKVSGPCVATRQKWLQGLSIEVLLNTGGVSHWKAVSSCLANKTPPTIDPFGP